MKKFIMLVVAIALSACAYKSDKRLASEHLDGATCVGVDGTVVRCIRDGVRFECVVDQDYGVHCASVGDTPTPEVK